MGLQILGRQVEVSYCVRLLRLRLCSKINSGFGGIANAGKPDTVSSGTGHEPKKGNYRLDEDRQVNLNHVHELRSSTLRLHQQVSTPTIF
jgi:hypothetical protein